MTHDTNSRSGSAEAEEPQTEASNSVMQQSNQSDAQYALELADAHLHGEIDDCDCDHDDDHEDDDDDEPSEPRFPGLRKSSRSVIANWLIDNPLKEPLAPIFAAASDCVLVETPDVSWCDPLQDAIVHRLREPNRLRSRHESVISVTDTHRRGQKDAIRRQAISVLSGGQPLVILCDTPHANMPKEILGLIDTHARITGFSDEELRAIVTELAGADPGPLDATLLHGLSFDQICGALRLGDNAARMMRRVKVVREAAHQTKSVAAPKLDSLHGYGEAKRWGLRLAREIDRFRAGQISLSDLPRGLLLSGPPGCGKTLFAQSLAATCATPIVETSVAQWFQDGDGHLGDVMSAIKRVFSQAHRQPKPVILFIDECDALIDPTAKAASQTHAQWWNTVRAGVLSAVDGAGTEPGLILIGACNFPEIVDAALRRSGRLDKHIRIPPPDPEALAGMLRDAFGTLLPDADYSRLAQLAIGMTGADIARIAREVHAQIRDLDRSIVESDIEAALMPKDDRSPEQIRRTAIHEAGHAFAAHLFGRDVIFMRLGTTNQPDHAGSVMLSRPGIFTRELLHEEVVIALSGRAAEHVFGLDVSSGASVDLTDATELLVRAHCNFGLGETLDSVAQSTSIPQLLFSDERLKRIVSAELDSLWKRACMIMRDNRHVVEAISDALIERRTLAGDEIAAIVFAHDDADTGIDVI